MRCSRQSNTLLSSSTNDCCDRPNRSSSPIKRTFRVACEEAWKAAIDLNPIRRHRYLAHVLVWALIRIRRPRRTGFSLVSYADIVEFMFQSGCVMDKCGMKAVSESESKSDCFGLIGAYHIWDVWQVHTSLDGYGKARRCRRSATSSTAGSASPPHGMAARQGARHHARLLGEPSDRLRSADLRPQHLGRHPPARGGRTPGRLIQ